MASQLSASGSESPPMKAMASPCSGYQAHSHSQATCQRSSG